MSRRSLVAALVAIACAAANDPWSYRLEGDSWRGGSSEQVLEALQPRYAEYFSVILDPAQTREPDLRPLRRDIERAPVDRRNYDALNAIAIGYFELNWRATEDPGGATYFADSFRAAKLLAVPWRAYGPIEDGRLRGAILTFFEDAGSGVKPGTAQTAPRLAAIVASLEAKEDDPGRRERIQTLAARLRELEEQGRSEAEEELAPLYTPSNGEPAAAR